MTMKPDAIIDVRFKTTSEGGRRTPIKGDSYACPLFIDGEGFDCRILLNKELQLGQNYQLPVKFLNRDLVISKLSRGRRFTLWEGKDVASGRVLEVLPK